MRTNARKSVLLLIFVLILSCSMLFLAASVFHIISPDASLDIADFLINGSVVLRILIGVIAIAVAVLTVLSFVRTGRNDNDAGKSIPLNIGNSADNAFVSCSVIESLSERMAKINKAVRAADCVVSDVDISGITLKLRISVIENSNMVEVCSEIRKSISELITATVGVNVNDVIINIFNTIPAADTGAKRGSRVK